jgi:alanine racemase
MPSLRAQVSTSALAANLAVALEHAGSDPVADLRRDAWGHGFDTVAAALAAAGVRRAVVDPGREADVVAHGLTPGDCEPSIDGRTLFGLPGGDGVPVLRLAASVLSVKRLLAGEGVSYNYTHRAERDTMIALVAGGFGQGVARALGNHVSVEHGDVRHPIVGRVAMDVCVVDIGDSGIRPGDEVVYFGGTGPARDAVAEWETVTGMTGAELVCALGLRVAREVVA